MKRLLASFAFLFGTLMLVQAQEFRLNAYAGYVFDDRVDSYYSNTSYFDGTINGGLLWGAGLEYKPSKYQGIELLYMRQDTDAPTTYYDNGISPGVKSKTFDFSANWIMLGTTRYMVNNPKIEPYFGGGLGVGIMNVSNPTSGSSESSTKFAWHIKGGLNFWASEKVGIKLQANLMSAVQAVGGGLYFGTGGGGAGVSSYSSMLQFGLGGGLVFRFPKK
ncbi:acyloxyacyl hydrolase [Flavihumibacter rivuli]|uniref:acyloxyacyl hydrolase n=1 Tax=Flavihumibacter rivuli TaxID=2838156 RepID=UPI001BDE937F|nr:acyloxyacyl hydrolase [Flavihumibacter rivuli]ULQ55565.1 acyloxyacyl hydrolase [Flavihumibacter rivuli]